MKTWMLAVGLVLLTACGKSEGPGSIPTPQYDNPLMGAWLMFGAGGQGPVDSEDLDKEESILVLGDSTYSLTYRAISAQITFVETGKVRYNGRKKLANFLVTSTTGMDWSEGAPRKLLTVPDIVPWQRAAGQAYSLEYTIADSLLQLSGGGFESTWFIRMPQTER